jgi:hypothetical protein
MIDAADEAAVARAGVAVARAVGELAAASARTEVLAEFTPERRVLGLPRAARMTPVGRVWRLGALLLDEEGRVYRTGRVVRAQRSARKSIPANAVAEQRAYRAAAVKGGIAEGETVVFDAVPLDLGVDALRTADGPLLLASIGGSPEVVVRWDPARADALIPLSSYLADRVDLLAHPPQGA